MRNGPDIKNQENSRLTIGLLIAVTLLKGVLWSAAIPVGQAPDEPSHLALVQFIGEFGRLPGADDLFQSDELAHTMALVERGRISFQSEIKQQFSTGQSGPNEPSILDLDRALSHSFESKRASTAMHVPPLYHLIGALGYRLVYSGNVLTRIFAVRLVSVVLSCILVWVAHRLSQDLFPKRREMWLTVPLLVSFHPMITFLGSVANSDILLFVLFTSVLWLSVRVLRNGLDWQHSVALGAAIGLGILTKPMILSSGAAVAVALLVNLVRRREKWLHLVLLSTLILLVSGLVGGWSLWRNYRLQGELLYSDPASNPVVAARANPRPDLTLKEYWTDTHRPLLGTLTLRTFWGAFGWIDTFLPDQFYELLRWSSWAAAIGVTIYLLGLSRQRSVPWTDIWLLVMLMVVSGSLLFPMFLRGYYAARQTGLMGSAVQGRYQLGAWAAQASLFVLGLTGIVAREHRGTAHLVIRLAFIYLNVYALTNVLVPRYY